MNGRFRPTLVNGLFTLGGALIPILAAQLLPPKVVAPIVQVLVPSDVVTSQRVRELEAERMRSLEAQLNMVRQQLAEVSERLKATQTELGKSQAAAEEARERTRLAESKPADPPLGGRGGDVRELPGAGPPAAKPSGSVRREGPIVAYIGDYTFEARTCTRRLNVITCRVIVTNRGKERKSLNLCHSYAIDNLRNQYPVAPNPATNGVWVSLGPGPRPTCTVTLESELPLAVNVSITGSESQASSFSLVMRDTFGGGTVVLRDVPMTAS